MKNCPKCNDTFDPGKWNKSFCSRKCANSKVFTAESILKKSHSAKAYVATLSKEIKQEQIDKGLETRKNNILQKLKIEDFDNLSIKLKRQQILLDQNQLCDICLLPQQWNNSPLNFHLDHISGDRKNNTRSNLRMICPNCHSQTATYGGKNGGKITNIQITDAIQSCMNNHKICLEVGLNPSAYSYSRIENLRISPSKSVAD